MSSYINIAVPPDADPDLTEKLLTAIRVGHSLFDLRRTVSLSGEYHWDGGSIHPSENVQNHALTDDGYGGFVASESYGSLDPLASTITSIIACVTGHTRC